MSQTVVNRTQPFAFPGLIGSDSMPKIDPFVNAETDQAAGQIAFGVFVASIGGDQARTLAAGRLKIIGAVVHSHDYARTYAGPSGVLIGELGTIGLLPKARLQVMRRGRIWVLTEQDVAVEDRLRIRHTTGTTEIVGAVRLDAVANKTIDARACVRVVTAGSAGGLCEIEIDSMNLLGAADT